MMTAATLEPRLPADSQVPVVVLDAGGQAPELLSRHAPVWDPELSDVNTTAQHRLHRAYAQRDPETKQDQKDFNEFAFIGSWNNNYIIFFRTLNFR